MRFSTWIACSCFVERAKADAVYRAKETDLYRRTNYGCDRFLPSRRDRFKEILDQGPYEFVSIDSQHRTFNEERLVEFCEMAGEYGVHVWFRIKHTRHVYMIGNYLDLGPCGILFPQTEFGSTVDEALRSFY